MRVIPSVAKACANGVIEPLNGQAPRPSWRWTPPQQRPDHTGVAEGIEPKWGGNSNLSDHDSAQCWTECPADIDACAVCGDRRIQHLLGNQLRNDRLPCRGSQRTGCTAEKRE